MVFVHDAGGVFGAPLDTVWEFVSSGETHSTAHRHRNTSRKRLPGDSGEYSWEQEFDRQNVRFTMRWTVYPPVGIVYEVLEGPFTGSKFFLYYVPRGAQTEVVVAGEFVSPTLETKELASAVDRFFATEFEQDRAGIEAFVRRM